MRNILPLFIVFLFMFEEIHASNIGGKVIDQNSSDPIDRAEIIIVEKEISFRDTVYSDVEGNWDFEVITGIEENFLPDDFLVRQNYPNPFNPSTNIEFQIPHSGNVDILIHNILGELLDYQSQSVSAGSYSVKWNGAASAGVYFYTIKFANASITKKMIQLDGGNGKGGLTQIKSGVGNFPKKRNFKSANPKRFEIIISKFAYVPDTLEVEVSGGEFFETTLETIHSRAFLFDLHNDVLEVMASDPGYNFGEWNDINHTDLPRMKAGGIDAQFFAGWVSPYQFPGNPNKRALEMIGIFNQTMNGYPGLEQAFDYEDVLEINENGKIAGLLAIEGGHAIENDLNKLKEFYELGVRYMTITWNNSVDWAVSAQDDRSESVGLSEFGREVIRTMDSLGMIIDVSHTGIKTIEDILEVTNKPVIATHSGVRSLRDHYRNLYDDQIIKIANSGGVIGVVFYPPFLTDGRTASIGTVIKHINYIVDLAGIDHVAVGSDFDGIGTNTVSRLDEVSDFPVLTEALLKSGYSRKDVEKILGGNVLRVLKQAAGN